MTPKSVRTYNGQSLRVISGQSHWILSDTLLGLADGDPDLVGELIDAFQTSTKPRLTEIRRALVDSDPKSIRAGIHSIKGSALQMGANTMASMCLGMELAAGELPAGQPGGLPNDGDRGQVPPRPGIFALARVEDRIADNILRRALSERLEDLESEFYEVCRAMMAYSNDHLRLSD